MPIASIPQSTLLAARKGSTEHSRWCRRLCDDTTGTWRRDSRDPERGRRGDHTERHSTSCLTGCGGINSCNGPGVVLAKLRNTPRLRFFRLSGLDTPRSPTIEPGHLTRPETTEDSHHTNSNTFLHLNG